MCLDNKINRGKQMEMAISNRPQNNKVESSRIMLKMVKNQTAQPILIHSGKTLPKRKRPVGKRKKQKQQKLLQGDIYE